MVNMTTGVEKMRLEVVSEIDRPELIKCADFL